MGRPFNRHSQYAVRTVFQYSRFILRREKLLGPCLDGLDGLVDIKCANASKAVSLMLTFGVSAMAVIASWTARPATSFPCRSDDD